MTEENKTKTTIWIYPSLLQRVDSWMEYDNSSSRSEFIDKAIRFYMGYLASEDVSEYLSKALAVTLKGILTEQSNRLRSMLFKLCVEVNMLCHTMAAHYRADEIDRRGLRAYAVQEVKETNGKISFDNALDVQREIPDEVDL